MSAWCRGAFAVGVGGLCCAAGASVAFSLDAVFGAGHPGGPALPVGTFGTTGTPIPDGIRLSGNVLHISGEAWEGATAGTGGRGRVTATGTVTGALRARDRLAMALGWSAQWTGGSVPTVTAITLRGESFDSAGQSLGVVMGSIGPLSPANGFIQWFDGLPLEAPALGAPGVRSARWTVDVDFSWGGSGAGEAFRFAWVGSLARVVLVPDPCPADINGDGNLDPDDLSDFITCFFGEAQSPRSCAEADYNRDGSVDPDDLSDYITQFFASAC